MPTQLDKNTLQYDILAQLGKYMPTLHHYTSINIHKIQFEQLQYFFSRKKYGQTCVFTNPDSWPYSHVEQADPHCECRKGHRCYCEYPEGELRDEEITPSEQVWGGRSAW